MESRTHNRTFAVELSRAPRRTHARHRTRTPRCTVQRLSFLVGDTFGLTPPTSDPPGGCRPIARGTIGGITGIVGIAPGDGSRVHEMPARSAPRRQVFCGRSTSASRGPSGRLPESSQSFKSSHWSSRWGLGDSKNRTHLSEKSSVLPRPQYAPDRPE